MNPGVPELPGLPGILLNEPDARGRILHAQRHAVMNYYVLYPDNTIGGPFTASHMIEIHQCGSISDETPAAAAGDSNWQSFRDLLPVVAYEAWHTVDENPVDFDALIRTARNSGPPTSPELARLLQEEVQSVPCLR